MVKKGGFIFLMALLFWPAISFAVPVYYSASGSLTDIVNNTEFSISGHVIIDDSVEAHSANTYSFRFIETSLSFSEIQSQQNDYYFSGNDGELYFTYMSAGITNTVDRMWFMDDDNGMWGQNFLLFDESGTQNDLNRENIYLSSIISLPSISGVTLQGYNPGSPISWSDFRGNLELTTAAAPVPEPATMILLGIGSVAVLAKRRRK